MLAKSRALRFSALVLGLTVAGSASAFSLIGFDWSWQSAPMSEPFLLNANSFPSSIGSSSVIQDILESGLESWGDQGDADFAFTNGGFTSQTSFTSDGDHIIQWSPTFAGGGTLAVAQSWFAFYGMTDCDIRVFQGNGSGNINWSSNPAGAGFFQIDLEQTVIHEFGHCAGLDHSGVNGSIMTAFATTGAGPSDRLLTQDDKNGLQAMYGVAVGADLELSLLSTPVGGQAVNYEVTGADPGRTIYFVYSLAGEGSGACVPVLGGECLGINSPYGIVGNATANAAGEALVSLSIPTSLIGSDLSLQAVDVYSSSTPAILSNPITATVLSSAPSCPAGETADCNGDCWDSTWVGDGFCDDGTLYQWGDPDYDCALFSFDGGDCP